MYKFLDYWWIFKKYANLKPQRTQPFLYWVPYFYSIIKYMVDNNYSRRIISQLCNDEIYRSVDDLWTRNHLYEDLERFIEEYIIVKEKRETEAVIIQEEEMFVI